MSIHSGAKIRVIHVVTRLDTGGLENGIVNICNNLDRAKYEPSICCLKGHGNMVDRLKPDVGIDNLNLPEGKAILNPFRLARYLKEKMPHVVHTHAWGQGSLYGILAARIAGVHVIINGEHGMFFLRPHQVFLQRWLAALCHMTLSVSEDLKSQIVNNLDIAPERIGVIPNGVDMKVFTGAYNTARLREELTRDFGLMFEEKSFVLGCIASLKPVKNQRMLLHALVELRRKRNGMSCKLLLVGEGSDRDGLQRFVQEHGLERDVAFLGQRRDIPEILSLLDALALVSREEGMSNALLEAMSSGVPIIATSVTGSTGLIHDGRNGLLITVDDVEELVAKIEMLMNNYDVRQTIAINARRFLEVSFSVDRMVSDYESVYSELLRSAASGIHY